VDASPDISVTPHSKRRILLVDDDLAVQLTLKAVLELHAFEVETASGSAEAIARMQSSKYDMIITDLRMETEEAGLDVIRAARRQSYHPATALLTAYPPSGERWHRENWERENSDSLLIKPLGTRELLSRIESLLARQAKATHTSAPTAGKKPSEGPEKRSSGPAA
jgi:DNA-binding response OmpR family regulator